MRSNTNIALGGSEPLTCPGPDRVLGGSNLSASMATSLGEITVMALDLVNWRAPLLTYLLEEVLPPKRTEATLIARRAKTFVTISNELYKQRPLGVLKKCILTD